MKRNFLFLMILLLCTINFGHAQGRRVLFIGDSITDGNWGGGGSSSKRNLWDMNHIFGSGYMYLCASYYQGNYPEKNYEFFNRGISGNTLQDLEKRWQEDAIDIKPDVLSVLVGINDLHVYMQNPNRTPFDYQAWENLYRSLLDRSLQANPNLKIILGAPFIANVGSMRKNTDFAERENIVHQCAAIVEKIAKDYHAVYLPYDKMFEKTLKDTPTVKDTYWIWDGVHPTPAGHRRMADLWMKRVKL